MTVRSSLNFRVTIGFFAIAIPLIFMLIYNNYYASNTVREQVAESNKNTMILYSNQIQAELNRETQYLYNLASEDPNVMQLSRATYDPDEYVFAKIRVMKAMERYLRFDSIVDFQFVYAVRNNALINTAIPADTYEKLTTVQTTIERFLREVKPGSLYFNEWRTIRYGDEYALLRLVDTGDGYYMGASVSLRNLMIPLDLMNMGEEGFTAFLSSEGKALAGSADRVLPEEKFRFAEGETFSRIRHEGSRFIVVSNPVQGTDTTLSAFIPEEQALHKLSYFQLIIYTIPALAAIVLIFYLIYLNDLVLKPMRVLLGGMRRIKNGDWQYRLAPSKTKEFTMINETFNAMASEIHRLKINVYEQEIQVHKAELKHLQLQMNPHFLLNAINIVYNLAQVKKFEIIQLMCQNLVKYFRFATQTHRAAVTIRDEMEHIESYINIQQLRFPERITYRIHIADELGAACIPPLLLQPFVENCIKYGFDFMDHPFHIDIRIEHADASGQMRIEIADNGIGFSEEMLVELHNGRYFDAYNGEHLGIWNVFHRLNIVFGREARALFSNRPDSGACVAIYMPVRTMEQYG
ncbi:sensor histidine kinase [Paenibacillus methanolicus]|uniref:Two-component system sensor histidine kinase YesM n=1 Tax=Paenibacillus methanolicus TaxID=582686 RepID=A0A5S5CJC3_9BACL|nr:sensor histidine kinase [Paenibacillus methanolicus]TYP79792.1 two-component system sensor histidine kinase YesM [Paenibacillus methanolicus]